MVVYIDTMHLKINFLLKKIFPRIAYRSMRPLNPIIKMALRGG